MSDESHFMDEEITFDAGGTTPARETLPPGWYVAKVIVASRGPSKNGLARMVNLTWEIDEGEYEKRKVYQSIVYKHETKPDAVKWGRYRLTDLMYSVGMQQGEPLNDLARLLYCPCRIKIATRVDPTGQYDARDEVKLIEPLGTEGSPQQKAQAADMADLKKATATPPAAFDATKENMNDEIPPF